MVRPFPSNSEGKWSELKSACGSAYHVTCTLLTTAGLEKNYQSINQSMEHVPKIEG